MCIAFGMTPSAIKGDGVSQGMRKAVGHPFVALEGDTTTWSYGQFMQEVLDHHPLWLSADQKVQSLAGKQMEARSAFDPILEGKEEAKRDPSGFLYRKQDAALVVPTWAGVDLVAKAGVSSGADLNPEDVTGAGGVLAVGMSLPLGPQLLWDQRRAAWKHAELMQEEAEWKREQVRRKLLADASKSYAEWAAAHDIRTANLRAERLAQVRKQMVIEAFKQREKSAMDTLEAHMALADRHRQRSEAEVDWMAARARLALYRWSEIQSLGLPPATWEPGGRRFIGMHTVEDSAAAWGAWSTGAFWSAVDVPVSVAENAKRLAQTQWMPAPVLEYRWWQKGVTSFAPDADYAQWKVGWKVPLLLRKSRGAYRAANSQWQSEMSQATWQKGQLEQWFQAKWVERKELRRQLVAVREAEKAAERLYSLETRRFILGESTLFLVNAREAKYLEAVQKRATTEAKWLGLEAELFALTSSDDPWGLVRSWSN
jgi:outer membrane protein TolC